MERMTAVMTTIMTLMIMTASIIMMVFVQWKCRAAGAVQFGSRLANRGPQARRRGAHASLGEERTTCEEEEDGGGMGSAGAGHGLIRTVASRVRPLQKRRDLWQCTARVASDVCVAPVLPGNVL